MNVMYCGDVHITQGVFLSALSLTHYVQQPLHVYVLTMDVTLNGRHWMPVSAEDMADLEALLNQRLPGSNVQRFDVSSLFMEQLPVQNLETRFTPCCMLRLYADLVEEIPERILYLDTDVLCHGDPMDFYALDLTGRDLAGVLDQYGKWWFHNHGLKQDYMNSGVLLLNMEEIRRDGLFAACRQMCADKQMFMPDQSALHKLAHRPYLADRKYNEQKVLHPDTVFQHFTTQLKFFPRFHTQSVKPWQTEAVHEVLHLHAYDDLFTEYEQWMKHHSGASDLERNVL